MNSFQTHEFVGLAFLKTKKQHSGKVLLQKVSAKGCPEGTKVPRTSRRRKSTRQREAKINGFVLSAFFQAF